MDIQTHFGENPKPPEIEKGGMSLGEDARKVLYQKIRIFGREALLSRNRIDPYSVPKGWHLYEVRHHPKDSGKPIQLGKMVLTSFFGTVMTRKTIVLPEGEWGYRDICGNHDLRILDEGTVTLEAYEKKKKQRRFS